MAAGPESFEGLPVWGQIIAAIATLIAVTWGAIAKFFSEKNKKPDASGELVVTNASLMDTKAFRDLCDLTRSTNSLLTDVLNELKDLNEAYSEDIKNRNMHEKVESMVREMIARTRE